MERQSIPLFPLNLVLFPRTPLPLHIFEDRYKEMFRDVLQDDLEFGVVLASDKGICNMGCSAAVEKVLHEYPDGRMDVLTTGRRRFEIESLDDERSYLRAVVQFFDDNEFQPIDGALRQRVLESFENGREAASNDAVADPEMDDSQLSFQIGQAVPDMDFRQMLLTIRSEAERMRRLADYLPGWARQQQRTAHIKTVAPRNGHTHWPDGLA